MTKKSILLVIRSLRLGGMERMTVNLANAYHRMGYDTHVLVLKNRIEIKPDDGVKLHFVDFDRIFKLTIIGLFYEFITRGIIGRINRRSRLVFRSLWFSPIFSIWLNRLERRIGQPFDLIIARGFGSFEGLAYFNDPRMLRIIVNSLWMERSTWADKAFFKGSFSNAVVLFNSKHILEQFIEICEHLGVAPKKNVLLQNPTDIEDIHAKSKERVYVNSPYILNVGRLEHAKNQQLLLSAFSLLTDRIPHKLVIIGDGSQRSKLLIMAKQLGISDRVIFTGALSNPYPWIAQADLFVLSSLHEGLPNTVIEALVCGTPVVVTRGKGGTIELMQGELTQFIAEMDSNSLADKITHALASPPIIKKELIDKFDMYKIAEDLLRLTYER